MSNSPKEDKRVQRILLERRPYRLKSCSRCLTINADSSKTCGVCGADLSNNASMTLEEAESIAVIEEKNRNVPICARFHLSKTGLFALVFGIGLTLIGIATFQLFSPLWPLLMIVFGGVFILASVDYLNRTPLRPIGKGVSIRPGGSGGRYIEREAEREEEEERKQRSGQKD